MRRNVLLSIVVVGLTFAIGSVVYYFSTTHTLKVSYMNVTKVSITDVESGDIIQDSIENESSVRLKNDKPYSIEYTGAEGFADGAIGVNATETEVAIDPDYSKERNEGIITKALPYVKSTLKATQPSYADFFTIGTKSIRDKASWLAIQLKYKGEYNFNSDNQIVLFKSSDNGENWEIIGEPQLYLTRYNTKDVPNTILEWANSKRI